jgi:hypothetical protein
MNRRCQIIHEQDRMLQREGGESISVGHAGWRVRYEVMREICIFWIGELDEVKVEIRRVRIWRG